MKVITACPHRVLDYVTVVAFALAPKAVGLVGAASTLAYALAGVHLLLTLVTQCPGGRARPVPLRVHGAIELVVGLALVVLPWLAGWTGVARTFYVVAGVVILCVWAASDYRGGASGSAPAA